MRLLAALILALPLAAQQPQLTPSRTPHAGRMNLADKTWDDWQRPHRRAGARLRRAALAPLPARSARRRRYARRLAEEAA